ncbi:major capsid protein P2 [Polaromonas sp.]|uniref:major capsid protein P2 n=1 Tax=Polaromonas sp. TaxID=1869339 RepID=UPI0027318E91|nr:major capsid protein P2 [Polaromonas sp.]MDP1740088.1 major capsid protein P2 [Polaromonas sp.]
MTRLIKLPQVENVGISQRATVPIPLGRTYNKIFLFCEGNITKALLSNIVLNVNNGEKQRWKTSAHCHALNAYKGNATDAAILEIDFTERGGVDEAAKTMGCYAMTQEAGVQSATLEFDIGVYVASAASKVIAMAEVDVPSRNTLIKRIRSSQKTLSGAVEESIKIPYGKSGEQLQRLMVFGTLASINSIRVRRDDSEEFETVPVARNEFYQKTYGKVPQAGLMVVDFIPHSLMNHMLNTALIMGSDGKPRPVENLEILLDVNAGGTFDIYAETLTTSDRP